MQLLVKAIVNVKEHSRKTKSGGSTTVRAHLRNIDKQAMIRAIAKERREGFAEGVDKAVMRHVDTGGRVIHLQHREGKWRTANTKPQDHARGSYIRLQDSKVHHYESGTHVGTYDLHDSPGRDYANRLARLEARRTGKPEPPSTEKPAKAAAKPKPKSPPKPVKAAEKPKPTAPAKPKREKAPVGDRHAGLERVFSDTAGGPTFAHVDAAKVLTDAHAYQFKAGGDEHGVTERLRDVKEWDPIAGAAPVMVHKRADGKLYVVDGHQRTGLARRLASEGAHVPALNALVFHEGDGYTVGEMRRIGALLNIQQGTGTAVDVAKILRERALSEKERRTMPQASSPMLKDGEALATLGDEAFTFVANGKLSRDANKNAAFGAIVARTLRDPHEQLEAMRLLAADPPQGREEAQDMVNEIKASGFATAQQMTLFGVDQIAESLHKPIAKIVGGVRRSLASEKSALGNAVRNKGRLEAKGSQIDAERAREGASHADALTQLLQLLHDKQGDVREALKQAAREVKRGELTEKQAVARIVGALEDEFRALGGKSAEGDRGDAERPIQSGPSLFDNIVNLDQHRLPLAKSYGGPMLLVKAIERVKQHERKTKSGGTTTVRAHVRNVDRKAMVAAIAKERRAGFEEALERAVDRHVDADRAIHLQHRDGAWRTSNTKPKEWQQGSYLQIASGQVHHHEGGKKQGSYGLVEKEAPLAPVTPKPEPKAPAKLKEQAPKPSKSVPAKTKEQAPKPVADQLDAPAVDKHEVQEWIPVERLGQLKEKIAKLNKRAVKLGLQPLTLEIGDREVKTREIVVSRGWEAEKPVTEKVQIEHALVTIRGESPRIGGWKVAGMLEHNKDEKGKQINLIHSFGEKELPKNFKHKPGHCDHCNANRHRTKTFILHKGKEVKQIGSNCVMDFTGHKSPERLLAQAEFMGEAFDDIDSFKDDDSFWSMPENRRHHLNDYLDHVAQEVIEHGWISRSEADGRLKIATSDAALDRYNKPSKFKEPTPEARKMATKAIAWAKTLGKKPGASEYERNVGAIAEMGVLQRNHFGLAASIVGSYLRHLGREQEEAARAKRPTINSTYQGQVGDKLDDLKLYVLSEHEFDGQYGKTYLYKFADEQGNLYSWFASNRQPIAIDRVYHARGTVKGHREYKGEKETQLTRMTIGGLADGAEDRVGEIEKRREGFAKYADKAVKLFGDDLRGMDAVNAINDGTRERRDYDYKTGQYVEKPAIWKGKDAERVGEAVWNFAFSVRGGWIHGKGGARVEKALEQMNVRQLVEASLIWEEDHKRDRAYDRPGSWVNANADLIEQIAGIEPKKPVKSRKMKKSMGPLLLVPIE